MVIPCYTFFLPQAHPQVSPHKTNMFYDLYYGLYPLIAIDYHY